MKPRIEKKVSKKIAEILKNIRGFMPNDVWVDNDYASDASDIHWKHSNTNGLTSKQKRQNWQRMRVSVDNMPSVGGELDYFGEGTDFCTVFEAACEFLQWEMFPCSEFDEENCKGGWPIVNVRLTGAKVIELSRIYASKFKRPHTPRNY